MAGLQAFLPVNVDFCNKKYTLVNAKQYDKEARYLLVSCYNGGEYFKLSNGAHSAFIRYKKPDGYGVFRKCVIDTQGRVQVELTEQMLAVAGTCVADLVIVSGNRAVINASTGKITDMEDGSIISTMIFHINVSETAVDNAEIESTWDTSGFNDALNTVTANFESVVVRAKEWADKAEHWSDIARQNAIGDIQNIVTGIRGEKEPLDVYGNPTYRVNAVTITAANVGAVSVDNVATVDEVKTALTIND